MTVAWPSEPMNDGALSLDLQQQITAGVREELEVVVDPLRRQGLDVASRLLIGRPFVEIIREVLQNGHDLVMKTARGRDVQRKALFGTTASHLLRKCPCPLWIVDPSPQPARRGVLAAVDVDTSDERTLALNRMIVELATSLAAAENAPVHVAQAWSVPFEDMIRHSPWLRVKRTQADDYVKEIEHRHGQRFDAFLAAFRPAATAMTPHLVKGRAGEVIPALTAQTGVEVIVMATLARGGVPGLLIDDDAEAVLGRIDCSVLTVKAADFVSPITL
jgi:nucleotide-binding universal stress UspA family protein